MMNESLERESERRREKSRYWDLHVRCIGEAGRGSFFITLMRWI